LDNSNHDNGGGDFSHAYLIMHKYFGKKPEMQKMNGFYVQLNMFCCMKISYTFCQHLGPQILSLMNIKNQRNGMKKELFSLLPFQNGFCNL
jgi:hypothetical protein